MVWVLLCEVLLDLFGYGVQSVKKASNARCCWQILCISIVIRLNHLRVIG